MDDYNESYWEDLPKDIVWIILNKLHTPEDILAFCGDSYLNEKFCQDKNGLFWEYLYHRDLSEEIELNEGETIKQKYLYWFSRFLSDIENAKTIKDGYHQYDENYKIIQRAIENGFEKIIELYSIHNDWTRSLFYYAVNFGKLNILRYLIRNNPNFITEREYDESNLNGLIGQASASRQYDILLYLIDEIAPIYNINPDLERALIGAISTKNGLPIVNMLLEKGVNIDNAINRSRSRGLPHEVIKLEKLKSELLGKNEQKTQSEDKITCLGQTKSGSRCCRTTKNGSQYCWQHEE